MSEALSQVQRSLVPLLELLVSDLLEAGEDELTRFFGGILESLRQASDEADLADPFLALVTTCEAVDAERLSPASAVVIDQILTQAISVSRRLAASEDLGQA